MQKTQICGSKYKDCAKQITTFTNSKILTGLTTLKPMRILIKETRRESEICYKRMNYSRVN